MSLCPRCLEQTRDCDCQNLFTAPPPANLLFTPQGTEAKVCEDIANRQLHGIQKYGTTVADNPLALKAWLQHAYEEKLDDAVYMRRAIEKIDEVLRDYNRIRTVLVNLVGSDDRDELIEMANETKQSSIPPEDREAILAAIDVLQSTQACV